MKRIALTFAFFLGFGSLGVQWAAAQNAPQAPIQPSTPVNRGRSVFPTAVRSLGDSDAASDCCCLEPSCERT